MLGRLFGLAGVAASMLGHEWRPPRLNLDSPARRRNAAPIGDAYGPCVEVWIGNQLYKARPSALSKILFSSLRMVFV